MSEAIEPQRDAFEALAMPHARSLFGVARRISGGAAEAEDLVQETYLRAYRTFNNFQAGTNARAWLFTILYSIDKNRRRSVGRRPATSELDAMSDYETPEKESGWGSHHDLLATLDNAEVGEQIVRAFDRLDDNARWSVLLVDVHGMTYEEAAEVMECPVGTIASKLFRARKRLYDLLAPVARERGYLA